MKKIKSPLGLDIVNKMFKEFLKPGKKKSSEKFSLYMRLYTNAIHAENRLNRHYYKRAFYHLHILADAARTAKDPEDARLLRYIYKIAKELLDKEKEIVMELKKDEDSDPLHSKTLLLVIENLCTLRILRELISSQ